MIAGDTELGVRLVSILLALPMAGRSIAPPRSCSRGARAATAAHLLNVTLSGGRHPTSRRMRPCWRLQFCSVLSGESTGDRARRVVARGRRRGRAALLSKYTALLFGPAYFIWLVSVQSCGTG